MLVLSRRVGEEIVVGDHIRVRVLAVEGSRVRVGIEAPASVRVDRSEVRRRVDDLLTHPVVTSLLPSGAMPEA